LAFPPAGLVNVAPHTPQAMAVVAREKMMASLLQSLQLTLKNWLAMIITSLVDEFEFLRSLARSIVRLAGFITTE
jgi:hypothetical protein